MEMKVQHIIPYEFIFSSIPLENRFSYLIEYKKKDLITLLSLAINYSGFSESYHTIIFEEQLKLLYHTREHHKCTSGLNLTKASR